MPVKPYEHYVYCVLLMATSNINTRCIVSDQSQGGNHDYCTNLSKLVSNVPVDNNSINAMWTGHRWYYGDGTTRYNSFRSYNNYFIIERFSPLGNSLGGVALHELMHTIGASDTYCDGIFYANGKCFIEKCVICNPGNGYDYNCIMTHFNAYSIENYPICNNCINDVKSYLFSHY